MRADRAVPGGVAARSRTEAQRPSFAPAAAGDAGVHGVADGRGAGRAGVAAAAGGGGAAGCRRAATSVAALAENFFRVPRRAVSHDDVQRQLREWERPALPS